METGTDLRKIQFLLGHRSLATTARYLYLTTTTVCAVTNPLDLYCLTPSWIPNPTTSNLLKWPINSSTLSEVTRRG